MAILTAIIIDDEPDVRQTAKFVKDKMSRYVNEKDWPALEIV